MRRDVLGVIREARAMTHAIVLTYNIDFLFVQSLVLPALKRCGHASLTIFADARRAAESYAHLNALLTGLGVRYRVIPVAMERGFSFHPKALFLSGPERATLLVGSGNLTFGGWRENGEVWVRKDTDEDGTDVFSAFRAYLLEILTRVPLNESIVADIEEAFDPTTRPWARSMSEPSGLLGKVSRGPSLLDQLLAAVGTGAVSELMLAAPYFDERAAAVAEFSAAFGEPPTSLLVPVRRSNLREAAARALPRSVTLRSTAFKHDGHAERPRDTFLHAKFYAVRRADQVHLFVGSANLSRAALTIPGSRGNAELLAHVMMSEREFRDAMLDELEFLESAPEFEAPGPDDDGDGAHRPGALQILGARLEGALLRLAFHGSPGLAVTECWLDGAPALGFELRGTILEVPTDGTPRSALLVGVLGGETLRSPPCWIDQEDSLRASAHSRALGSEIRRRVSGDLLNIGAWSEVLEVFCRHLQHMPVPRDSGIVSAGSRGQQEPAGSEFVHSDVFVDDAQLSLSDYQPRSTAGGFGRLRDLRRLMLQWFSGSATAALGDDDGELEETLEPEGAEDPERVDDQERRPAEPMLAPPPTPKVLSTKAPTRRELRRFSSLVERMREALTDPSLLEHRPASTLAGDLKLATVLLRTGLREGWMDAESFFSVTHEIWRALFFTSAQDRTRGWIELRHANAEDPATFRRGFMSSSLTAALAAWSLTNPVGGQTGYRRARFILAAHLSVARLEWLWAGERQEEVSRELAWYLNSTGELSNESIAALERAWRDFILRGRALGLLERALQRQPLAKLRGRVTQQRLERGELLWQGKGGWCVATEARARKDGVKVPVLQLQRGDKTVNFSALYTLPVRDVVDHADAIGLDSGARTHLVSLLSALALG